MQIVRGPRNRVNFTRGARIEALIARFRLKQIAGGQFRIILLSAVLNDVDALCRWLGDSTVSATSSWRPTARRVAIWERSGRLNWLYHNDLLRPPGRRPRDSLVQSILPWPQPIYPADKYPMILSQLPRAYANASYLARFLLDLLGGPILIVCGTKPTTRNLAKTIANELPKLENVPPRISWLLQYIEKDAKHLRPLAGMLERGVAYHNASLPVLFRKGIEDAIRQREITFTCSTTTLAEGVDLPFRTTIVFDWLFGFGDHQAPMPSLLFRNIAGRCGRAGEYVEGDTILFDNVLGNLRFTHDSLRQGAQDRVLGDPPPLESTIANDNLPAGERDAVYAVMSSQMMAAVPEHPEMDELASHFAAHLYSKFTGHDPELMLQKVRADLLNDSNGEPFARAASPLKLTPLGAAANVAGLSASSARRLLSFLQGIEGPQDLNTLTHRLTQVTGTFPEQYNITFSKLASGNAKRSFLTMDDWPTLSACWRAGDSLEEMFISLPKAKASKPVPVKRWADGVADSDYISSQYDKFVEVLEYAFGVFIPWMLRACHSLAPLSSNAFAASRDWLSDAVAFETARIADLEGVDVGTEGAV